MKENVVKGWITSLVGVVTMGLTLFLVFNGTFDFVWDGIGGLVIGCILLMAPQTIEKKVSEAIKRWNGSTSGDSSISIDPTETTKPQD